MPLCPRSEACRRSTRKAGTASEVARNRPTAPARALGAWAAMRSDKPSTQPTAAGRGGGAAFSDVMKEDKLDARARRRSRRPRPGPGQPVDAPAPHQTGSAPDETEDLVEALQGDLARAETLHELTAAELAQQRPLSGLPTGVQGAASPVDDELSPPPPPPRVSSGPGASSAAPRAVVEPPGAGAAAWDSGAALAATTVNATGASAPEPASAADEASVMAPASPRPPPPATPPEHRPRGRAFRGRGPRLLPSQTPPGGTPLGGHSDTENAASILMGATLLLALMIGVLWRRWREGEVAATWSRRRRKSGPTALDAEEEEAVEMRKLAVAQSRLPRLLSAGERKPMLRRSDLGSSLVDDAPAPPPLHSPPAFESPQSPGGGGDEVGEDADWVDLSVTGGPAGAGGGSALVSPDDLRSVVRSLPARLAIRDWTPLFATERDGYALQSLYKRAAGAEPCILLVRDTQGATFGAFLSGGILRTHGFAGTGESFVMQLAPTFATYMWTQRDSCFLHADDSQIGAWPPSPLATASRGLGPRLSPRSTLPRQASVEARTRCGSPSPCSSAPRATAPPSAIPASHPLNASMSPPSRCGALCLSAPVACRGLRYGIAERASQPLPRKTSPPMSSKRSASTGAYAPAAPAVRHSSEGGRSMSMNDPVRRLQRG